MRTLSLLSALLGLWLPFVPMPVQAGETRTVILRIEPEIDCPGCEARLKHILETTKGVSRVEMDVMESRATVRFDPAGCTVGRLCGRVATTGYTAKEVR